MSELTFLVVGIILGIALSIHVARCYHARDGLVGDAIRRALGK